MNTNFEYRIARDAVRSFGLESSQAELDVATEWNSKVIESQRNIEKKFTALMQESIESLPMLDWQPLVIIRQQSIDKLEQERTALYAAADKKIKEIALLSLAMEYTNKTVSGVSISVIAQRVTTYIEMLAARTVAKQQGRDNVVDDLDDKIEELICGNRQEQIEQHQKAVYGIQSAAARHQESVMTELKFAKFFTTGDYDSRSIK